MISVGNIKIGDKNFIPVQTMLKNPVWEIDKTLKKLETLVQLGCDILRITVPDKQALDGLKEILKVTKIPIVADIHFDYRLAIASIEAGVHKVRINPGNIGDKNCVQSVIDCLKKHNTPVRIGINKGSLPKHLKEKYKDPIKVMIESAREEAGYFREAGYDNVVLSFKSSTVMETIAVNRLAKQEFDYPLHIGVTEAGDLADGTIKNSIGIATLLQEGIGDTIRVSLTAAEEEEVKTGIKILEALKLRESRVEIISCPTCGRTQIELASLVEQVKTLTEGKRFCKNLKIAVMGCVVNGPGEAGECDFGIAGGKEQSILFKNGEKLKVIKNDCIMPEMQQLLMEYYEKD